MIEADHKSVRLSGKMNGTIGGLLDPLILFRLPKVQKSVEYRIH